MKIQYQNDGLTIFESALYQTTSTVICHEKFTLIVDPNWLPLEIKTIQLHLQKNQKSNRTFLLFTHSDYDHIIAYRAFPNAQVIASAALHNNPDREKIIQEIKTFDDQYYIQRDYPIEYPNVDILVEGDFQQMKIAEVDFIFCQAAGHNADGIFTLIPSLGIFIAGDYLCDVEFPFIYTSGLEYLKTLDKAQRLLETYQPAILIAGHGNFSNHKKEMFERIKTARSYIESIISSIKNKKPFDVNLLLQKYNFPQGMKNAHEKNVEILKKELE